MNQTLFVIPHFLFEGWLLGLWLVGGAAVLAWQIKQTGFQRETWNTIGMVAGVALVIHFILPNIEYQVPDLSDPSGVATQPAGLAIRGYGVMFLLAAVIGIGISMVRAMQVGLHVDRLLELAFAMFIAGIAGARLFYVIEYREQFMVDGRFDWGSVVKMTEGGLVVYGSVIGGVLAAAIYTWRLKLPMFAIADIIAPGMVIGLALGRIGCLLNGCCFGGVCEWPVALEFPAGSPPYLRQYETGQLLGMKLSEPQSESRWREILEVIADSPADKVGLSAGDEIHINGVNPAFLQRAHRDDDYDLPSQAAVVEVRGQTRPIVVPLSRLPEHSLPVHPTQIYSAVNAFLLCVVLWLAYPFRRNDGEVFALMLMLYAPARFVLEWVRIDEHGVWGTPFTISQMVSFATLALGCGLMVFVKWRRAGIRLPVQGASVSLDKND